MQKISITINTEGDAFRGGNLFNEIPRILSEYALRVAREGYLDDARLKDINGNTCGEVRIEL